MRDNRPKIIKWLMRVNLTCAMLSGVALLLMMAVGAIDVIGTNLDFVGIPSQPVPAAFEFMETMMVISVFLAVSLGQARRAQIRVEVLINMLPYGLSLLGVFIRHAMSLVFFGLIAWYGWASALGAFDVGEYAPGIINFPVWPARLVLAFGATLMTVQCLIDTLGVLFRRLDVERYQTAAAKPRVD